MKIMSHFKSSRSLIKLAVGILYMPIVTVISLKVDDALFAGDYMSNLASCIVLLLPLLFIRCTPFHFGFLAGALAVAAYFFIPFFDPNGFYIIKNAYYISAAILGIIFSFSSVVIQVIKRCIHHDKYVTPRDVFILGLIYFAMIFYFTCLFWFLAQESPERFIKIENPSRYLFLDILYFNIITFTTLGYGDIVPIDYQAKVLVAVENIISYLFILLGVGVVAKGMMTKTRSTSEIAKTKKKVAKKKATKKKARKKRK